MLRVKVLHYLKCFEMLFSNYSGLPDTQNISFCCQNGHFT